MQFLKGLFWFLLAVLVAVFAFANWTMVPIKLWNGLIADVNLPLLVIFAFLLGLVPTLLFHHAARWRWRQRLTATERSLTDLRDIQPAAPAPVTAAEPGDPAAPREPAKPGDAPPLMPPGSA